MSHESASGAAPLPALKTITPAQRRLGIVLLIALTACWGSTFVLMKGIIGGVAPSVLMLLRFAVGAVVLVPVVRRGKGLWVGGIEVGLWLWGGYAAEVVGLQYPAGNRSVF